MSTELTRAATRIRETVTELDRTVALPRPRGLDIGVLQRLSAGAPYLLAAFFFVVYFLSYPRTLGEAPVVAAENAARDELAEKLISGEITRDELAALGQ